MGIPIARPRARAARTSADRAEGARVHGPRRRAAAARARRSTSCSSAAAPTRGISDLRAAAACSRGRKVAGGVRALVVPGSQQVKQQARGRRARPRLPRGGRRVARGRLLDVHRHERRSARARPVRGQHQQPQLRGPAGHGRAHVPGQPLTGGRGGGDTGRITDARELL